MICTFFVIIGSAQLLNDQLALYVRLMQAFQREPTSTRRMVGGFIDQIIYIRQILSVLMGIY